jgi:hypothetical protein
MEQDIVVTRTAGGQSSRPQEEENLKFLVYTNIYLVQPRLCSSRASVGGREEPCGLEPDQPQHMLGGVESGKGQLVKKTYTYTNTKVNASTCLVNET